jgi:hypothetical protein
MKKIYSLILVVLFSGGALNSGPLEILSQTQLTAASNFGDVSSYYSNSILLSQNINLSLDPFPQNEPSIRISRTNPNYVVAAWRDFKLGYILPNVVRRIGYTYSTNGGLTWAAPLLLPDPNPDHTSQSDPVITSDAQGHFYISSTSRKPVTGYNRDMLLYKSTNNGQTFFLHAVAVPGSGGAGEDKEWIFCDLVPTNPTYNNIFISWTSFGPQPGIKFRKGTNGGANWSATVNVGDNTSGQGSNVCSGTGGQIYIVWASNGIKFDRSTNGGTSFGTDYSLSTVTNTGDSYPFITCDYSNRTSRGNVYVVWADNRSGNFDVYFQRSTNAGVSWLGAPVRINDVTTGNQYWPMVQCDTNGFIYTIYYDTRLGASQINSYIAYSTNNGDAWINNRLSDSSFTDQEPNSDVRFGDYIGVDAFNGKIIPVWTDQRKGYPNQEIYSATLGSLIPVNNISTEVPSEYKFFGNYPNPFNPATKLRFSIPNESVVKITAFDLLGKEVGIILNKKLTAGTYETEFSAVNLTSGIYFCKMVAFDPEGTPGLRFTQTRKLILIR